MKTFRNWIIRKLGGLVWDDLPYYIQVAIRKEGEQKSIDKWLLERLNNSFETKHLNNYKK